MEMLRAASLERPSLKASLDEGLLKRVFRQAVNEAATLDARVHGKNADRDAASSLTLTQVGATALATEKDEAIVIPILQVSGDQDRTIELKVIARDMWTAKFGIDFGPMEAMACLSTAIITSSQPHQTRPGGCAEHHRRQGSSH